MVEIVSVTKKGQATIPKKLRKKYSIKDKVIIEENEKGILLRPLPSPIDDFGSLKAVFKEKTSRQLIEASREQEYSKDKERLKRVNTANLRH